MKRLVRILLFTIAISFAACISHAQPLTSARLVEHRRIWNNAPHNSATDLTHFRGKWFCVLREGTADVSTDGVIRVLVTNNGHWWEPAALLRMDGLDLRDPKLSVAPDGKHLLVVAGAAKREGSEAASMTETIIARSRDGWAWEKVSVIGAPNYWLWRVTWHKDVAYGVAYALGPDVEESNDHHSMLFSSNDGNEFEVLIPDFRPGPSPRPTEATLRFDAADNMICLHRREGGEKPTALLGFSRAPYDDWDWKDLGINIGAPNFIQVSAGRWIACCRMENIGPNKETKTVVCEVDLDGGALRPLLALPSNGDSGCPGLHWHDGLLWISYHSAHEGKASIYLAKVRID